MNRTALRQELDAKNARLDELRSQLGQLEAELERRAAAVDGADGITPAQLVDLVRERDDVHTAVVELQERIAAAVDDATELQDQLGEADAGARLKKARQTFDRKREAYLARLQEVLLTIGAAASELRGTRRDLAAAAKQIGRSAREAGENVVTPSVPDIRQALKGDFAAFDGDTAMLESLLAYADKDGAHASREDRQAAAERKRERARAEREKREAFIAAKEAAAHGDREAMPRFYDEYGSGRVQQGY